MNRFLAVAVALLVVGASSLAHAGASRGPQYQSTGISGNSTDRYDVSFDQGETAQVRVHSHGNTMVEVTVYDGYGNVITSGNDRSGDVVLNWYVTRGGNFIIRVHNPASVSNSYVITTN